MPFESLGVHNEKHAIVVELGSAYTKCGFVGENGPRFIVQSKVTDSANSNVDKPVFQYSNIEELYRNLISIFHKIYYKYLLVNHRDRRVVVVENILGASEIRDTLAKVLFIHYEVPSVLFVPSHLMAVCTLAIPTALVMDVGHEEAVLLPICEGTPLIHAWQALPLAGKAVERNLESLLMLRSKVVTPEKELALCDSDSFIDARTLEDIKVRTCFVTSYSRARQLYESKTRDDGPAPPTSPSPFTYPVSGKGLLYIEGSVREEAAEVLFNLDSDFMSLATMVLDSIIASPIDMRMRLAENILIVGGTAMLPGFKARLMAEVKHLMQHSRYKDKIAIKCFKVHRPPAKENYVAWLGGAIIGATEAVAAKSVSREAYLQMKRIPDWSNLADNGKEMDRAG